MMVMVTMTMMMEKFVDNNNDDIGLMIVLIYFDSMMRAIEVMMEVMVAIIMV